MQAKITTDPVADLLARIRNASLVGHEQLVVPASSLKTHLLKLLKEAGYVGDFKVDKADKSITVNIAEASKVVNKLRRLSKPGRRLYVKTSEVPYSRGLVVVSTSQGLMSADEARKRRLGGELICEVY